MMRSIRSLNPLILASRSPRREKILKRLIPAFEIVPVEVAEKKESTSSPRDLVQENAHLKAAALCERYPDHYIIGSDTVVCAADSTVLGKPRDRRENIRMLRMLSGTSHYVYSGVCLVRRKNNMQKISSDCTEVRFHELSLTQIEQYIDSQETLDKAGGYGLQDLPSSFVAQLKGSYDNVVGFPSEAFLDMMAAA
jgi:septum formation protein